jgi:hypothetical protein
MRNNSEAPRHTSVYRQTDYLSFLVTLQQQQLAAEQLLGQYQNDFALLNYLCGLRDTTLQHFSLWNSTLYSKPGETVFAKIPNR